MDKFTLIKLEIIIFFPIIAILFIKYRGILARFKKLLVLGALTGLPLYFIGELAFMYWKTYFYNYDKTLGIIIRGSVIEILIWCILVTFITSAAVIIAADKEETRKPFL